jgi:hypothetical protein
LLSANNFGRDDSWFIRLEDAFINWVLNMDLFPMIMRYLSNHVLPCAGTSSPPLFSGCFSHWAGAEFPCRIVGLNSWDGPTTGLLQCSHCSAEYFFDLIDWDERDGDKDIRIFSLSRLPQGSFKAIVDACPKTIGGPFWPVWLPRWEFVIADEEKAARSQIDVILAKVERPELVIAWLGCWPKKIIATKPLAGEDLPDVEYSLELPRSAKKGRDWFSFLGLERRVEPS